MIYEPKGTLAEFHASNEFVRGLKGPIGSGKSVGCAWEIWTRASEQAPNANGTRKSRWVATRNTYGELLTTTLQTWLDWFPEERFGKVVHGAPIMQTLKWPLEDKTDVELQMWFMALDRPEHVKKLLSLECTGAWMNEAREQPKAVLDYLTGRVGRYPPPMEVRASWFGIIMDTNPPDSDSWWYRLEENKPKGFKFWNQPPGDSPEAENVANLPPGYYERLKAGKTAEWIKVYVRGQYGFVIDGKPVYPEYRDELHCKEFDVLPNIPIDAGMDFGLTPAGLFAQRAPNGQIRILSELVSEDMGVKQFGGLFKIEAERRYPGHTFSTITGDPAGVARGHDEKSCFMVLAGEGVDAQPAFSNDWTIRREAFAAPMTRLIDGEPGLLVHPRCKRLRKALLGGYCYRRQQVAGTEKYHDKPVKDMHSHVAEAGQYLVLGMGEGHKLQRPARMSGERTETADTSGWEYG